MRVGWVDPLLEWLWQRNRRRWFRLAWWLFWAIVMVAVGVALTFHVLYHQPSTLVAVRTFAVVGGFVTAVYWGVIVRSWVSVVPAIRDWLRGDTSEEAVEDAWEVARSMTQMLVRRLVIAAAALVLPGVTFYLGLEYDLRGFRLVTVGMAAGLAISWGVSTIAPLLEVFFRPMRRELGHLVAAPSGARTIGATMRTKVLVTAFMMSMLSGASIAVAATVGDRALEELGQLTLIAIVIPFTTGGMAIFLLARSLLSPIDDLMTATEKVSAGDITARSIVTTDDEIGALALHFNEMLDNLERVAAENANLLVEVQESRARIVAASDAERRRVERNLHDGAQQRLTALALRLRMIEARAADPSYVQYELQGAIADLRDAHEELRELARGLHPSILSAEGLEPALRQLAERSTVSVDVHVLPGRFGDTIESTAWFVASEALANIAKYARATSASISLERMDGHVILEVADNGVGGAHIGRGSGLTGLSDRVAAVGGRLSITSPEHRGTLVRAELPVEREAQLL